MTPPRTKRKLRLVNPFCTGGGGSAFECLVAVSYLISLLREEVGRGTEGVVRELRLQQRNQGHPVDDITVVAELGCRTQALYLQAKHGLRFSDNGVFNDVIAASWQEFSRPSFRRNVDKVGLAVGSPCIPDMRDVISWAVAHTDADRYLQQVEGFHGKRKIVAAFEQAISSSARRKATHSEVWRFLRHLVVLQFDFEDRDGVDCWNKLLDCIRRRDPRRAKALFEVLRGMVVEYAPKAGEITRQSLVTRIQQRVDFDVPAIHSRGTDPIELLAAHVNNRIAAEKNSKKYIPNIFVEIGPIKEKARLFCDPALFLQKVEDDVRGLRLRYVNRILTKSGLQTVKSALPAKRVSTGRFNAVARDAAGLDQALGNLTRSLARMADHESQELLPIAANGRGELLEHSWPYLRDSAQAIASYTIPELSHRLRIARSRVFCIVSRAGQGKTNFVCDLVERVLMPRRIPCVLFTGRELRGVGKGQLCEFVARSVIGASSPQGSIDELLKAMEDNAARRNVACVIIIDGLNEHDDLPTFATEVERFIERCMQYSHTRVMLTCRSEYFDARFANICNASFAALTVTERDIHRNMSDPHRTRLIEGYLRFFDIRCRMNETVQRKFADDPLLLRFFCEAYAGRKGMLVTSICLDALFRTYLGKKLDAATETTGRQTGFLVGNRHPYGALLRRVVDWMVENSQFGGVPISVFQPHELAPLTKLIDEDLFLVKDLTGKAGALNDQDEAVSFTFGELRDFLIADHLLSAVLPQNARRFEELVRDLTAPSCTVSEGVGQYLFFGSRRRSDAVGMAVLEKQGWYEEVMVRCVFDLEDREITGEDIRRLKQICLRDDVRVPHIIARLITRFDKQRFQNANIGLLFDIFDEMSDAQFAVFTYATFGEAPYEPRSYYPSPVTQLMNDIRDLLRRTGDDWDPAFAELARLVLYLWDTRDLQRDYPARRCFAEFEQAHPTLATSLRSEHVTKQRKGYRAAADEGLLSWLRVSNSGRKPSGSMANHAAGEPAHPSRSRKRPTAIKLRHTEAGIVMLCRREPTLEGCMARAKVRPGSYAAEIVHRIYESYVEDSIDLKEEFDKYYSPEYGNVYRFLYEHYGCDAGGIRALSQESASDYIIRLVRKSFSFGRDWNTGTIVENVEEGDRALFRILDAEWV
jgi:hypothetical protein